MLENISLTDLTNDSVTVEENTLKFTCLECKFPTISKEGMDSHISQEHTLDNVEQVQFKCRICGHAFSEAENYDIHIQVHDNESIDIKEAENIVYITIAEQEISSINQPVVLSSINEFFKCDEGGEIYSCREDRTMHKEEHTYTQSFECNNCIDTLESMKDLEKHIQEKHTIETKIPTEFVCEKCQYRAGNTNE